MESDRPLVEQPDVPTPTVSERVLLSAFPIPVLVHTLDPAPSFAAEHPPSESAATRHPSSSWVSEGNLRRRSWKSRKPEASYLADSLSLRCAGEEHLYGLCS